MHWVIIAAVIVVYPLCGQMTAVRGVSSFHFLLYLPLIQYTQCNAMFAKSCSDTVNEDTLERTQPNLKSSTEHWCDYLFFLPCHGNISWDLINNNTATRWTRWGGWLNKTNGRRMQLFDDEWQAETTKKLWNVLKVFEICARDDFLGTFYRKTSQPLLMLL